MVPPLLNPSGDESSLTITQVHLPMSTGKGLYINDLKNCKDFTQRTGNLETQ